MKSYALRFQLFALAVLLMAACGPNRENMIDNIEEHEMRLSTMDVNSSDNEAATVLGLYRQFVAKFPDDSLAPAYLLRAADLCINIGQPEQAVAILDSVIDLYPGFEDVAGCCFLKGYAYELAGHYDEAREAYTYFVENYPEHYLAEDARKTIPYIGMTPEEMFEAIMANATDQNLVQEN